MRLALLTLPLLLVTQLGCSGTLSNLVRMKVSVRTFDATDTKAPPGIVTVWVHGTSQNPLVRKWHTSPRGVTNFEELPDDYTLKAIGRELDAHDPNRFPKSAFYTFGWSGELSFKAREVAGRDLDQALRNISTIHQMRYGKKPRLRLVTHSHGCNVALNASDRMVLGEEPIVVDELVFLACPVQYATASKLKSSAFKNIYGLFSTIDLTQVMDPQGLNLEGVQSGGKLFSDRRFKPQQNLVQAQIRWDGLGLWHIGFVRERFGKALPSILDELRSGKREVQTSSEYLIDVSTT